MEKNVLITAAASGVGNHAAPILSNCGFHVIAVDLNPCDNLLNTAATYIADLKDFNALEHIFHKITPTSIFFCN